MRTWSWERLFRIIFVWICLSCLKSVHCWSNRRASWELNLTSELRIGFLPLGKAALGVQERHAAIINNSILQDFNMNKRNRTSFQTILVTFKTYFGHKAVSQMQYCSLVNSFSYFKRTPRILLSWQEHLNWTHKKWHQQWHLTMQLHGIASSHFLRKPKTRYIGKANYHQSRIQTNTLWARSNMFSRLEPENKASNQE